MPELPQIKTYHVNEIFYTLQGEGVRAGCPSVFLRFQGCNLKCNIAPGPLSPGGFACDTEFQSGRPMTGDEIAAAVREIAGGCGWVVLTGGEPGLQLDAALADRLHADGFKLAIETNGTVNLDALGLDWICVSPKVAEHALAQTVAHEVKYVRAYGQAIPRPRVQAEHKLVSPAFHAGAIDRKTLEWCVQLCKDNPPWRLSLQLHQLIGVR